MIMLIQDANYRGKSRHPFSNEHEILYHLTYFFVYIIGKASSKYPMTNVVILNFKIIELKIIIVKFIQRKVITLQRLHSSYTFCIQTSLLYHLLREKYLVFVILITWKSNND